MSSRSRENSCGTGSRDARHPVSRAGRRGLSGPRRWRASRRSAARRSTGHPRPRRPPASPARPPADRVEPRSSRSRSRTRPTATGWSRRWRAGGSGGAVNRKRVLRVMRERRLIQRRRPLGRRRRPGFFRVERPDQLWHLDMTSVWVAEHGWVYLMAAIDCCTREIVAWHLETRCRATRGDRADRARRRRARHRAGHADARHRQRLGVHRARLQDASCRPRDRASPRRLPRPREPGVHRVLVRQAQGTLRLARGVRDARPGPPSDRRLRRPLPPPAALTAELQHAARSRGNLERRTRPPNPSGLNRTVGPKCTGPRAWKQQLSRCAAQPATTRFRTGCNAQSEPLTRASEPSGYALEPNFAPGRHRVPSNLDPVVSRARVAAERQNRALSRAFP